MNNELPIYEPDSDAIYQVDIVARLTGISSQEILHYQEQGLIRSTDLDDETVYTLRRIEHLKELYETNLSGLKLILNLMEQVDQLKAELRARH